MLYLFIEIYISYNIYIYNIICIFIQLLGWGGGGGGGMSIFEMSQWPFSRGILKNTH